MPLVPEDPLVRRAPRDGRGPRPVATVRVASVRAAERRDREDALAVEEPLEIRAAGPDQSPVSVAVTMRTPGHDDELAVGFLATEGLITAPGEVVSVGPCTAPGRARSCNVVAVRLVRPFDPEAHKRNFFATSSCGICGKASLDQIAVRCAPAAPGPVVPRSVLVGLPDALRGAQRIFEQTGGLHATGLFEPDGRLLAVREDVGRHNAVDKLLGRAFRAGDWPLAGRLLLVSGRLSFEIVQKAAVAGVPIVAAVSAPSSLAVAVAERFGMTLVGFLRGPAFNIYTHPERIDLDA